MAATPGNQWWKLRSKHGCDAIFTSPKILEEECNKYFENTDARNDWDGQDWVGKDGEEVVVKKKIPYTLSGLCVFLGVSQQYFKEFKKSKTFLSNKDFLLVLSRVEDIIETQRLEGALNRYYPENLVSRINGYADKNDIISGGEPLKAQIIVQDKETADNLKKLQKQ